MFIFMGFGFTAFLALILGGGQHFVHRWIVTTVGTVAFGCMFLFVMLVELLCGMNAAQEIGWTMLLTVLLFIGTVMSVAIRGDRQRVRRIWTPGT